MDLTPDDLALAEQYPQAGAAQQAFRPWPFLTPMAVGGVLLLLVGLYGFMHVHYLTSRPGPVPQWQAIGLIMMMVLGLGATIAAITGRRNRALICEDALVVREPSGKDWILLWDDITAVTYGRRSLALTAADGKTRRLPGPYIFPNYFTIAQAIYPRVRDRLMREAVDCLEAREPADFGKQVQLTHRGLRWRGQPIDRENIEKVAWRSRGSAYLALIGVLRLPPIDSAEVSNIPVLLELLRTRLGVAVEEDTRRFT